MIFSMVSVVVPTGILIVLPKLLKVQTEWLWLLIAACLLFFISWYLPSPTIDGQQTEFVTHFVGGGIFTGLLWLYVKLAKGWQSVWWVEAASLFALVSVLGVTNELFELFLYAVGYMPHGIADTSWDLLANTLGAATVFVVYGVVKRTRRSS